MKNTNKAIVFGSIGLAVLFYVWLTNGWWKLGFMVINTGFLVMLLASFGSRVKTSNFWRAGWVSSLVLGGFVAIRSSEIVSGLNILTVMFLNLFLGVMAKEPEAELGFERLVETFFRFLGNWIKGLWDDVVYLIQLAPKRLSGWGKIVTGILLSLPLLVIFGGLFYSADPIFASLINRIKWPNLSLSRVINSRTVTTVMFFGAMMATVGQKLADKRDNFKAWKHISEVQIAAIILQGLFLIFGLIQIRYFGVTAETLKQMGITFSQYTRQGYSQMVISSLLAWGVVYGLDYLMRSQKELKNKQVGLTRMLSWAFMAEILVFIAAATKRNWLYQSAYGFTQLRILGFWLSVWLVAVVVATFIKIRRGKEVNFLVRSMIMISLAVLIGINLFNIDRTIAVTRPAKLAQGIDYEYMARLSNDAVDGWDEILDDIESRIDKSEVTSIGETVRLNYILRTISGRESWLVRQSNNNWNYGGNWNISDARALKFLSENKEKIGRIDGKLVRLLNETRSKEQTEVTAKANEYRGRIREILLEYKNISINDLSSWTGTGGSSTFMQLKIGEAISEMEIAKINTRIIDTTGKNCYIYQTAEPQRRDRFYTVMCTL